MSPGAARRYRVTVHELRDGKATKVIDAHGTGFVTAVAALDDDVMEVHFGEGGPGTLQRHVVAAIAHEYPPRRRR